MKDPPFTGKKGALSPAQRVPKKDNPDQNAPIEDRPSPDMNKAHPDTPAPADVGTDDAKDEPGTKAGNPEGHTPDKPGAPQDEVTDGKAPEPAAKNAPQPQPAGTPTSFTISGTSLQTSTNSIGGNITLSIPPAVAPGPDGMKLRGYAMNTAFAGNGLYFRHDGVAQMDVLPDVHFNVTHDRDVKNIAGTAKMTHAMRYKAPMEARKLSEGGRKKIVAGKPPADEDFESYTTLEDASLLGFAAELHETAPGYFGAAKAISYLRSIGKTPNVSVSVKGSKLSYDMDTDRVYMEAPYSLVHLALVDKGAFDETTGVGVHAVAPLGDDEPAGYSNVPFAAAQLAADGAMMAALAVDHSILVSCSVELADMPLLVEAFLADASVPDYVKLRITELGALRGGKRGKLGNSDFACPETRKLPIHDAAHVRNALARFEQTDFKGCDKSAALARIHAAAKKFGIKVDSAYELAFMAGRLIVLETSADGELLAHEDVDSELSYTEAGASEDQGSPESHPGDLNMTTPTPPTKVVVASADLEARIAALEAEKAVAVESHLNALRGQIAADYGLAVESLGVFKSAEQLEAYRTGLAAAKGNPLPRVAPTDPRIAQRQAAPAKRPHEIFAEENFDTKEWAEWRTAQRAAILSGKNPPAVI